MVCLAVSTTRSSTLPARVKDVIIQTQQPHLSVVPARISLAKLESKLVGELDAHFRLKDRLDGLREEFPYIVIDCPPTLGLLTVNALVAATHLMIPIQSSYFALEGTDDLLETVEKVRVRANPGLQILGVVITMHDKRTSLGRDIRTQIHKVFGAKGFQDAHHEERPPGGEPGVQGINFYVRARVDWRDGVLQFVGGGYRTCLDEAYRKPCACVTTSTTSKRWRHPPLRRSVACCLSNRSIRILTSRGR